MMTSHDINRLAQEITKRLQVIKTFTLNQALTRNGSSKPHKVNMTSISGCSAKKARAAISAAGTAGAAAMMSV
jgi:hypothetical protein